MRNMDDVTMLFQRVAFDTMKATKPTSVVFGTVESIAPLQIRVDQKLVLTQEQLYLTRMVVDYEVEMTVDHLTEDRAGGSGEAAFASHNHEYKGRKKFLIHNALEVGDQAVMLQNNGGQLYIVIDKVVKA